MRLKDIPKRLGVSLGTVKNMRREGVLKVRRLYRGVVGMSESELVALIRGKGA